jgi:hypothetical protein
MTEPPTAAEDDALVAQLAASAEWLRDGNVSDMSERIAAELDEAAARIAALTAELAELDPPPEHCGCREAQCPHLPIRKQSRKELGEHWRKMIALERGRATKAEAALAERDKDAERHDPAHIATGWANDAPRLQQKINSTRHHVRALQMLVKAQHSAIDWPAFEREVDAIDAAIRESKEKP